MGLSAVGGSVANGSGVPGRATGTVAATTAKSAHGETRKHAKIPTPAFAAGCRLIPEKAGMDDKNIRLCPFCGGPVNVNGHTLVPVAPPLPTRHVPASPAPPPDNDPASEMTPTERFARAIERRDALIRDRRIAGGAGRRSTDSDDPRADHN